MAAKKYKTNPTNQDVLETWKAAVEDRYGFDRQWYINSRYYDNDHHVVFNRVSNRIEQIPEQPGKVRRTIPKTTRAVDSMVNMLAANDFKWTIRPPDTLVGMSEEDIATLTDRVALWLDQMFEGLKMRSTLVEMILLGFKYPVAYLWPGYDQDTGEFYIDYYDAFDIYFDRPNISDPEEANQMFKVFTIHIDELRANPNYINTDSLHTTTDLAVSKIKAARENEKFSGGLGAERKYVNCIESWRKVYREVQGQPRRLVMEVTTITDDGTEIRPPKDYDITKFPVVAYKPRPGPLYQPAWIELVISMNKSIDSLSAAIEGYAQQLAKPRLKAMKNAKIKVTDTPTMQLIEYDGGLAPEWLEQPSMSGDLPAHLERLERQIEEATVSSVNMGRVPGGVKAARAIETIKEADFANLTTAVLALKETIGECGTRMIEIAAEALDEKKAVGYGANRFTVIGNRGIVVAETLKQQIPEVGLILVQGYRALIEIENGLGFTQEGKRDTLVMLAREGIIDQATVLKGFRFSNIREIMAATAAEKATSIIQTNEFELLPDELKMAILEHLKQVNDPQQEPLPEGGEMNG